MDFLPKVQTVAVFDAKKATCFFQRFTFGQKRTPESFAHNSAALLEIVYKNFPVFFDDPASSTREKLFRTEKALFYAIAVEDVLICIEAGSEESEIILSRVAECIVQSMRRLVSDRSVLQAAAFAADIDTFCFVLDAIIDDGVLLTLDADKVVKEVKPFVVSKTV